MKPGIVPEDDPTSIGNILVSMKLITPDNLKKLVEEFRRQQEELLGQFLVRKANISPEEIELALIKQKQLRGEKLDESAMLKVIDVSRRSQSRLLSKIDGLMVMAVKVNKI